MKNNNDPFGFQKALNLKALDDPKLLKALKGLPRSIKLYGSNSVEGLLLDIREVKPLAVDDWKLIEKIISNQKNN
jgi:hypothetical protein